MAELIPYIACQRIALGAGEEYTIPDYSGAVFISDHTSIGGIAGWIVYSYASISVIGTRIEAKSTGTSNILVYFIDSKGLVIKNNTSTNFSRLNIFKIRPV